MRKLHQGVFEHSQFFFSRLESLHSFINEAPLVFLLLWVFFFFYRRLLRVQQCCSHAERIKDTSRHNHMKHRCTHSPKANSGVVLGYCDMYRYLGKIQ